MRRTIVFTIRPDAGALTSVLDFLTARFTYHDRTVWAAAVAAGRITCNETPTTVDTLLQVGDRIAYTPEEQNEPEVDPTFTIRFDDPLFCAIDKSGNLPCHPGGRYFNHTLWALLKSKIPAPVFVNRLDRETSGLVLVAKTADAAKNLRAQFAARLVEKRYTVFVEGAFDLPCIHTGWLMTDPVSVVRKRRLFVPGTEGPDAPPPATDAEWSETRFEPIARWGAISEVAVFPQTGRLHQIRATLCAYGFPVVGDKLYGFDAAYFVRFCQGALTSGDRLRLRIARQALHADQLRFRHPKFGSRLTVTAPLPADLLALRNPAIPDVPHD